jgi:hypothetical protein
MAKKKPTEYTPDEGHQARFGRRQHARIRLRERYGIIATGKTIDALELQIRQHRAYFIRGDRIGTGEWSVRAADGWLPIVYDRERQTIVTILPANALPRGMKPPTVKELP